MIENNKSFYPSDLFEFIHHPEYGCGNLKGLITPSDLHAVCAFHSQHTHPHLQSFIANL
jgi:hypothetical protein